MVRVGFLKTMVMALAAVGMLTSPAFAQQAEPAARIDGTTSPTIVESLGDARDDSLQTVSTASGALLGAAGGVLLINVATGGAALGPIIGLQASNLLGGAWSAAAGIAPVAGPLAIHTISAATAAVGGALMGMYLVGD